MFSSAAGPGGGKERRALGEALGLGLQLAGGMAFFSLAGYYLDQRRGGGWAWTFAGMTLGFIYGAYELWKVVRLMNEAGRERGKPRDPKEPGSGGHQGPEQPK